MLEDYARSLDIEEKPEWKDLVTFVPNKKTPVYNWFYYKEGFARDLVMGILDMFSHDASLRVLDPFCGSGTTLLACRELGIDSVGFDVLPVSIFASGVKTKDYDIEEIRRIYSGFRRKFERLDSEYPHMMKRAFSKYALEDISFLKRDIRSIEDEKYRDFFLLALISAAMKCSYAWKDGGAIKIRKQQKAPLRIMFRNVLKRMAKDTGRIAFKECTTEVMSCDARMMELPDESIGSIITSPPYLNNIDYTKVYAIEEFFIGNRGLPPLRSYIGSKVLDETPESFTDLPPASVSYFVDMEKSLREMYRVCVKGANAGLVVGNGYLPGSQRILGERISSTDAGGVVDSDVILAHLAERIGFSVEKIIVLNKRFALENRTEKVGTLRESLVWLKKEK